MTRDPRELGSAWRKFQRHSFPTPSPDLAGYVERFWVVSWDYREPYRQLIVPYPNVHLTFRGGAATVNGVSSGHQIRVLEGRDGVFGVAFRPGCFRPFLGASVATITDRSIDAREVFGPDLPDPLDVVAVERFLRAHWPESDPRARQAADIVAEIAANPSITRVDALAQDLGTSVRQLQRLFAEYVGIGPKWVIRRYRLHEVTERLTTGVGPDWASLAAELGYADQAHFVRDFKEMFGESPTRYAERY
ncbi:helix-turn-helix domain-containing protein [Saccharopolyspora sp. K220]|uniref:helix-turn-helix domain-containing protein n=1 Tax=Saccharopolyspora soli TaxID=2926618 RepID=UPI001F59AF94|nr:helix-turn-helix domain-containing protein [Saccharopolyspora soli]MCI2423362.1 helix-turn-helix domain-containing protein [Saccharopolyspora soli]